MYLSILYLYICLSPMTCTVPWCSDHSSTYVYIYVKHILTSWIFLYYYMLRDRLEQIVESDSVSACSLLFIAVKIWAIKNNVGFGTDALAHTHTLRIKYAVFYVFILLFTSLLHSDDLGEAFCFCFSLCHQNKAIQRTLKRVQVTVPC